MSLRPSLLAPATILALLLGGWLRLYQIGADPFWYDETQIAPAARGSIGHALEIARSHVAAPPLDYLVTWAAGRTLGENEFTLRWPEAMLSLLTLALAVQAARQHFGRQTAVLALWILAAGWIPIRYAQELRFYSWYALGFWLVWLATGWAARKDRWWSWIALLLVTMVSAHAHYFTLFGLLRAPLDWLNNRRLTLRQLLKVALVGFGTLMGLAPWLSWTRPAASAGTQPLTLSMIASGLLDGLGWLGFVQPAGARLAPMFAWQLPWIVTGAVGWVAAFRDRARRLLPVALAVIAFAIITAVALGGIGFVGGRYFFPLVYPWAMLAAWGVQRMAETRAPRWRAPVTVGGVALLCLSTLPTLREYYAWPRTNAPEVVARLPAEARVLVFGDPLTAKFVEGEAQYYFSREAGNKTALTTEIVSVIPATSTVCASGRVWLAGPSQYLPLTSVPADWQPVIPPEDWYGHIALFGCP